MAVGNFAALDGILGLSVVGGADHASRVFGQGKPGVYISKVCMLV